METPRIIFAFFQFLGYNRKNIIKSVGTRIAQIVIPKISDIAFLLF
jgi:hypothetical protein